MGTERGEGVRGEEVSYAYVCMYVLCSYIHTVQYIHRIGCSRYVTEPNAR